MIRLFVYLGIVLALAFGFSWIANNPGDVTLNWQGMEIRTSLMVVVVALVAIIAVILFVWGILRGVIGLPYFISRYFANRRRDRGYNAVSKGLIAAGTGDTALARQLTKESAKLLKNEPLVDLLDAQTALLEGNKDTARNRFQSMLDKEETKLLGLRGLYLEAEQEGAREAARQYAEEAVSLSPALEWAGQAKLRNLCLDGNWEEALKALESNRSAGLLDKETAKRHRAVLLTARAIAEEPAEPDLALKLASEAHRLAPGLVPAAVIGASAAVRGGKLRKASKMLETTWRLDSHPELAEAYVHLRLGDSANDRLKRAQTLAKMRSESTIGKLAIAEAAIDAKEWQIARDTMHDVITGSLTERACLIMADLEEGEHGDAGRMREWLAKAVRAPKDAVWTADGYISEIWLPVSPATGAVDVFEWKVPVEQLQDTREALDIGDLAEPLKPLPVAEVSQVQTETAEVEAEQVTNAETLVEEPVPTVEPKMVDVTPTNTGRTEAVNEHNQSVSAAKVAAEEDDQPSTTIFPLKHRPDDPGVAPESPDVADEASKGYKVH